MIYDQLTVFSSFFLTSPLEIVALSTSLIYLMIYLIDITNIDKICDKECQKNLYKLIGCEARQRAEQNSRTPHYMQN